MRQSVPFCQEHFYMIRELCVPTTVTMVITTVRHIAATVKNTAATVKSIAVKVVAVADAMVIVNRIKKRGCEITPQ